MTVADMSKLYADKTVAFERRGKRQVAYLMTDDGWIRYPVKSADAMLAFGAKVGARNV